MAFTSHAATAWVVAPASAGSARRAMIQALGVQSAWGRRSCRTGHPDSGVRWKLSRLHATRRHTAASPLVQTEREMP